MKRSFSIQLALTAKRFVNRNPGTDPVSFSKFGISDPRRELYGAKDVYAEKLRSRFQNDEGLGCNIDLFSKMVQSRPLPSMYHFNEVISTLAKHQKSDVIIALCQEMEILGIPHNIYSCKIIMDCFCDCSHFSLALSFLGKMVKLGYAPLVVAIGSLLNDKKTGFKTGYHVFSDDSIALCESGYASDAHQVFLKMKTKGIRPSLLAYRSVISGLCKLGRWNVAAGLLHDMRKVKDMDLEAMELYKEISPRYPHLQYVLRAQSAALRKHFASWIWGSSSRSEKEREEVINPFRV